VREEILRGVELFQQLLGQYPQIQINHSHNPDSVYWGHKRFVAPVSWLYRLGRPGRRLHCSGEQEGSPHFWGDVVKKHVRYVRNLTFNRITGFYEAPVQLKANGGVLLVDDFGRQRVRPQELLNRWIVPLESRVDYLTLHTGKKFEVPFDTLVAFATNLDPADLADEAFLRRIPYKIHIGDPTAEQFERIFELNCRRRQLPFHRVLVTYLQRKYYGLNRRPMRACHPRDLLDQVTALCRYRGSQPAVTRDLLDQACEAYFVHEKAAG